MKAPQKTRTNDFRVRRRVIPTLCGRRVVLQPFTRDIPTRLEPMRTRRARAKPRPTTRRTSAARSNMAFVGEAFAVPFPPQTRGCKDAGGKVEAFRAKSREQGGRNQDLIMQRAPVRVWTEPPNPRAIELPLRACEHTGQPSVTSCFGPPPQHYPDLVHHPEEAPFPASV